MAIKIVDGLDLRRVRPGKQHRTRAEERLDVVGDIAKRVPDFRGNAGLAAEVGERCL